MNGWDDPQAPAYYESFYRAHSRYALANAALISHARIEPGLHVLDLGAGTGRTAEAVLSRLGDEGRVVCVEPSEPMRAEGMRRVRDPRVEWHKSLPEARGLFDRVLCGAAIWQFVPLAETVRNLADLLCPGGALCFNIPALYLLEPDQPGGGSDPMLLALPALLPVSSNVPPPVVSANPLGRGLIVTSLRAAGLSPRSWSFRLRMTQDAYAA
jgi:SAM-dependent methyltransferase